MNHTELTLSSPVCGDTRHTSSRYSSALSLALVVASLAAAGAVAAPLKSVVFREAARFLMIPTSSPNSMAVDKKGNAYFVDHNCQRLSATTTMSGGAQPSLLATGCFGDVAVDTAGNVFATDRIAGSVVEFTGGAGNPTTVVTGLLTPTGLALDQAGNLYVAERNNNRVVKFAPGNNNPTVVATGLSSPSAVAVDPAGTTVYVADTNNNRIAMAQNGGPTQTLVGGLNMPQGVAVDRAGNVYIADTMNKMVLKKVPGVGNPIAVTGDFDLPTCVRIDESGRLFTVDQIGGGLAEQQFGSVGFDPSDVEYHIAGNGYTLTFAFNANVMVGAVHVQSQATSGSDFYPDPTSTCHAMSYGPGQTCTVVLGFAPQLPGMRAGAVVLSDPAGAPLMTVWLHGMGYGPLTSMDMAFPKWWTTLSTPSGVAPDGNGSVYIADTVKNRVVKFSFNQQPQVDVPAVGLTLPRGVAVDGAGNLYIADTGNNRVVELYRGIGPQVTLATQGLKSPTGIAVDALGNIYIADSGNNRIVKLPADHTAQVVFMSAGLNAPAGVTVDSFGNVYIADTGNNRILEQPAAGGNPVTLPFSGLTQPQSVAVDAAGNVYTGSGKSVLKYRPGANFATSVGTYFSGVKGVALDGNAGIYITDSSPFLSVMDRRTALMLFQAVKVGTTVLPQYTTVSNIGNRALSIGAFSVDAGDPNFSLVSGPGDCVVTGTVAPGAFCSLEIQFTPTKVGDLAGTLMLWDNSLNHNSQHVVSLAGKGF